MTSPHPGRISTGEELVTGGMHLFEHALNAGEKRRLRFARAEMMPVALYDAWIDVRADTRQNMRHRIV